MPLGLVGLVYESPAAPIISGLSIAFVLAGQVLGITVVTSSTVGQICAAVSKFFKVSWAIRASQLFHCVKVCKVDQATRVAWLFCWCVSF